MLQDKCIGPIGTRTWGVVIQFKSQSPDRKSKCEAKQHYRMRVAEAAARSGHILFMMKSVMKGSNEEGATYAMEWLGATPEAIEKWAPTREARLKNIADLRKALNEESVNRLKARLSLCGRVAGPALLNRDAALSWWLAYASMRQWHAQQ